MKKVIIVSPEPKNHNPLITLLNVLFPESDVYNVGTGSGGLEADPDDSFSGFRPIHIKPGKAEENS
jgi:hypothetical protein